MALILSVAAQAQFPLRVPRGFAARMRRGDPTDPLLRQVLPLTDEEEAALLEAEADADAGRVVPHSEVRKWLLAVGTPDEFPMPESWLR